MHFQLFRDKQLRQNCRKPHNSLLWPSCKVSVVFFWQNGLFCHSLRHFDANMPQNFVFIGLDDGLSFVLQEAIAEYILEVIVAHPFRSHLDQGKGEFMFAGQQRPSYYDDKFLMRCNLCDMMNPPVTKKPVDYQPSDLSGTLFNHLPLVPHICVSESGQNWSR